MLLQIDGKSSDITSDAIFRRRISGTNRLEVRYHRAWREKLNATSKVAAQRVFGRETTTWLKRIPIPTKAIPSIHPRPWIECWVCCCATISERRMLPIFSSGFSPSSKRGREEWRAHLFDPMILFASRTRNWMKPWVPRKRMWSFRGMSLQSDCCLGPNPPHNPDDSILAFGIID